MGRGERGSLAVRLGRRLESEQGELTGVFVGDGGTTGYFDVQQAMSVHQHLEIAGVGWRAGGEAHRGEDEVQRVSYVFELGVKFVAVVLEPILQTFEQIGGAMPGPGLCRAE